MFHVMCAERAEKGGREAGCYQKGLKLLRPLPSPSKGTALGLVAGWGGEPFAWCQPIVPSKEHTRVWTTTDRDGFCWWSQN